MVQRAAPRASFVIGVCSTIDLYPPAYFIFISYFKALCAGWVYVCVGVCMYVCRSICKCVVEAGGQCHASSLIAFPPYFSDRISH